MDFLSLDTLNRTADEDEDSIDHSSPVYISIVVIFVIICFAALCANIAIVYTIYSFKKLQNVRNVYIANWAIADIYPSVIAAIEYVLYPYVVGHKSKVYNVVMYLVDLEHFFYTATLLFTMFLVLDWYLASYFVNYSEKYRKHQRDAIATVWVLTAITVFLALVIKVPDLHYILPAVGFFLLYIIVSGFVITLQIIKKVKEHKGKFSDYPTLSLSISSVCLLLWLERWIDLLLVEVVDTYHVPVLQFIGYVTSVVVFFMLYRCDRDFRECFRQKWKSNKESVGEAQNLESSIKDTINGNQHA